MVRPISLVAGLAFVAACGTPETVVLQSDATASDATTTTTTTILAGASTIATSSEEPFTLAGFDAEAMTALFPIDSASIVLWAQPRENPGTTVLDVRITDASGGSVLREMYELEESEDDSLQLVLDVNLSLETSYILSIEIRGGTTDTTDGGQPAGPLTCSREIEPMSGGATAYTVVPNNVCWWPTVPQWRTPSGIAVSPEELFELAGPGHCEWESVRFLGVGPDLDTYYARDALGVFGASWYTPGGLGQGRPRRGQDTTSATVGTTGYYCLSRRAIELRPTRFAAGRRHRLRIARRRPGAVVVDVR